MRHEAAKQGTHLEHDAGPRGRAAQADCADDAGGSGAADVARLVADAAQGDEAAWETLVHRYSRRIYALAKSRLHDADAAEEIAQSVFATLAGKLRDGDDARYTELGKFEPWLFRIAINRIRDEGRRRMRRRDTVPLRLGADSEPRDARNDREPDNRRELGMMREAIQTLDDKDREIIELRHHGSLAFARIAEILGEPIGTCLARHHRAIKKLRAHLEAAGLGVGSPGGMTDA